MSPPARYLFVNDGVTVAVVDAAHDEPQTEAQLSISRYLTPIANAPLITHVVGDLARNGIQEVLVLCPQHAKAGLSAALGSGKAWQVRLSYLDAGPVTGTGAQLRAAARGRPMVFQAGDCLFPGHLRRLRERFATDDLDLAMLAHRGPAAGVTPLHNGDTAIRLPRERPLGTALVIGPRCGQVLEELPRSLKTSAAVLRALEADGCRVGFCDVGDHWCYAESTEQLLLANRLVLDGIDPHSVEPPNCHVEGRVLIHPSAAVSHSKLRGPLLIGARAVVRDSFVGPYTSIGTGAVVVGAELDNAMVLAAAEVRYPGPRLEGSVIGERAVVSRTLSLPRAVHLRLPADSQVTLA